MNRNEYAALRIGQSVVRKGQTVPVADIDRTKERVQISGHWVSYRNVELPLTSSRFQPVGEDSGPAPEANHWEWKDGCLRLRVKDLVKYGFPVTALLHTVEECGRDGFVGSSKDLHERLPFLPPEYIRNLVPKMCREGLLLRDTIRHGIYRLTTVK